MPAGDHEERIRTLEEQIAELRERIAQAEGDAAAARVLAGGADRDVAEMREQLRVHTRLLTALRDTQIEQGSQLAAHGRRISTLEATVSSGFAEMRAGFAEMRSGMAQIVTLIEGTRGPRAQP